VACHIDQTPTPQLAEGLAAAGHSSSFLTHQLAKCDSSAALTARPQLWRPACAAGAKRGPSFLF